MKVAPIPPADRDILQAFLEEHLLGGHPVGSLAQELASVSAKGIAALNDRIATFLGSDSPSPRRPHASTSRSGHLARLTELLDSVSLLDGHQSSRREATVAPSRPDDTVANDALRAASPRNHGWQPRSTAANALGKSKDTIARLVDELRREKIAQHQAQGIAADAAEKLVEQEYIAFHERPMHRRPRFGYTDLSPAAVHDLAARAASQASWSGNRKLAGLLGTNPQTTRDLALQCRARKIEETIGQGRTPEGAEQDVQKNYSPLPHTVPNPKYKSAPRLARTSPRLFACEEREAVRPRRTAQYYPQPVGQLYGNSRGRGSVMLLYRLRGRHMRIPCGLGATLMSKTDELIVIQRVARRLLHVLTHLTESDIAHYTAGRRNVFLGILEQKYRLTADQAETALSSVERHCADENCRP